MIKIGGILRYKFTRNTLNAKKVNEEVLKKILQKNASSEFGKKYGFSKIHKISEFKEKVELSSYDDYEKYIMRMCEGEKNILVCEDIEYFGLTSGTTGKQKLIPVTKSGRKTGSKYMGLYTQKILYDNFKDKWNYGRGVMLTDMVIGKYTPGGIPISSATSGGMRSIKNIIPFLWTSPVEVMNMKNKEAALYLHILFALREKKLMYIGGVFISSILDFFRFMESNWHSLVNDIRRGRINNDLDIEPEYRAILLKKIAPSAGRADELENEFKKGFMGITARIWPELLYIVTVTGGSFSIYDDKVGWYTDNLTIYSNAYAATEGTIAFNPYIYKLHYVILPDTSFFEFIPLENLDDRRPPAKCINELEKGREYEIVITNYSGLYRYRLGDIIKVVDYYNNCPEIQFSYRRNQLLNMAAEKTSEQHVNHALGMIVKKLNIELVDYTTSADNSISPGRYIIYLEVKGRCEISAEKISEFLDRELSRANIAYSRFRSNKKLGRLKVVILKEGTFNAIKNHLINSGVSRNQLKIPRVINNKDILEILESSSEVVKKNCLQII